jgi:glutaredoxin
MQSNSRITIYTRKNCCLCDDAKVAIRDARTKAVFEVDEIDIDSDPELQKRYNDEVPVVEINGSKAFKYRVSADELLKKLAARQ